MPKLLITVDLDAAPWYGFAPATMGHVERIGVLPGGMTSGKPSVSMDVRLQDGTHAFVEMSLRQFQMAAAAFKGGWGDVAAHDEEWIEVALDDTKREG